MEPPLLSGTIMDPATWLHRRLLTDAAILDPSSPQITNEIQPEISRISRELQIFTAVVTVLIMVAGIVGNLLTIIALLRCPRVRNVAAAFIISLCVADFIFCLAVLPFSISRFVNGGWIHGEVLCNIFPFMRYGNVGVSLLSIAMITINRYIMIAHHSVYARIYKPVNICLMIAFCWIFSYGLQLPTLAKVWGQFGVDTLLGTCSIIPDENGNSSKTALFVIAFIIPCLVIIVCYAGIFWVVHSSETRMRKHVVGRPSGSGPKTKEDKTAKKKRNEWRITQMVLAIFLSYVVCYLPITITKTADHQVNYPGFHVLGYLLLYFSACVNPIIYVIMNKQYRHAYRTVLTCSRPRMLSFTGANNSSADKSRDGQSKTMLSQVSFALSTLQARERADELPEVFEDNEKL